MTIGRGQERYNNSYMRAAKLVVSRPLRPRTIRNPLRHAPESLSTLLVESLPILHKRDGDE